MEEQTVWVLLAENHEDSSWAELYATKEKAIQAMKKYFSEIADEEDEDITEQEWDIENLCCSWFDANYNEYSTYLTISKQEVK